MDLLAWNLPGYTLIMSRSERNREKKRKQPIEFLNARVEDFKLFKEEKEKESINYTYTKV